MVCENNNNLREMAAESLIRELCDGKITEREKFFRLHRKIAEQFKVTMLTNDELAKSYHKLVGLGTVKPAKDVEGFIRLKKVRSLSGIVVVSVLTKPYDCPGNCLYCPTQKGLPKSYMKKEPAVMRAVMNKFDPYLQVQNRLEALRATGHALDKINIRVIGGTWSYYPEDYQRWFIEQCFQAANQFNEKRRMKNEKSQGKIEKFSLEKLKEINEEAECRIVEISIETRQDYINLEEIKRLRKLGVTKVELGVQSIYDDVLTLNRRGHDVAETVRATKLLKDAGFKVAYQIMLNLYGADFRRDEKMLKELFADVRFRPDYLKIYPLAVVKEAEVYKHYVSGELKVYNQQQLMELIKDFKMTVPKYLRIERIIRDIPSEDIVEGGAKISNLRQMIVEEMEKDGVKCRCIRCREVKNDFDNRDEIVLFRENYAASDGQEIFLSLETAEQKKLYSMLRLRIPSEGEKLPVLNDAAVIREIHTYGPQAKVGTLLEEGAQHRGLGRKLLEEAERIAKEEFGYRKIAVIAGVGVRNYFRKNGYELEDEYMVKEIG